MTSSSHRALLRATQIVAPAVLFVLVSAPGWAQSMAAPPTAAPAQPSNNYPANVSTRPMISPVVGPNYLIHSGDQLAVQVYGDQSLSQNVVVLGDGTIQYPLVGQLKVSGQSPTQAAERIKAALQKYVRHPIVTVAVMQEGMTDVLVFGDVRNPGRYTIRSGAHLTDAIAAAGGLAATNGDFPPARVSDAAGTIHTASLQRLLHDGDTKANIPVDSGAIVYVPGPAAFQVQVVGAVDHPGNIELNEGDRLSVAIAKAGNSSNSHADLNHVRVTRSDPTGHAQQSEINMYQALEHGDMRYDPILQKGDVVYVPQARNPGPGTGSGVLYFLGRIFGL